MTEPTPEIERIFYHMLWALSWVGDPRFVYHSPKDQKMLSFRHRCASAGEWACELLREYGYGEDDGQSCVLTEKGRELMARSDID